MSRAFEAETQVLGAIMLDNAAVALPLVVEVLPIYLHRALDDVEVQWATPGSCSGSIPSP